MIKLIFWLVVLAIVYFWYRGQKAITARKEAEINAQRQTTLDVDSEVIDITPPDSNS